MKKMLIMSSLVFASALHTIAAEAGIGKTTAHKNVAHITKGMEKGESKGAATAKRSLSAVERTNHLTDQMVRDLRLTNYQARQLRKINQEKVDRMMAIEAAGGDESAIDNQCKGVCKDRDKELETLLSTEQYSDYFSKRPEYYKFDKDYAGGGYLNPDPGPSAKADNLADNDDELPGESNQVASR
jgi:Spy/CpxP family protein refolding chaperone